jgi:hypothetical protein
LTEDPCQHSIGQVAIPSIEREEAVKQSISEAIREQAARTIWGRAVEFVISKTSISSLGIAANPSEANL